jgi:outer membrane receptor protein involved in Fe transport
VKIKNLQNKTTYLSSCVSVILLSAMTGNIQAQDQTSDADDVEQIQVVGSPIFRDRTSSISPALSYGVDFFQSFEPTTVGDMLKRTPGISFTGDVGEYDAPQMRGLGAGYTQVLINGRKIPSTGSDRAVFVDRIPAEMVKRIEIIRSPSADQDSQGVGGTINIILKDGASFEGGNARLGLLRFDDGELRGSGAFGYSGDTNNAAWNVSATFQERYVPKLKIERRFDPDGTQTEEEQENDVRDSDDLSLSANLSYTLNDKSSLDLSANFVSTSREKNQTEIFRVVEDGELVMDGMAQDDVDIEEDSYIVGTVYTTEFDNGTLWESSLNFSRITSAEDAIAFERDSESDPWEYDKIEDLDTTDSEILFTTSIKNELSNGVELKTGLDASRKKRDETLIEFAVDSGTGTIEEIDLEQRYEVKEERIDGFVLGQMEFDGDMQLELGVRVEHTRRSMASMAVNIDTSETQINPSAHFSKKFDSDNTMRMSIARTVRRPDFKQLSPTIEFDEPEDGDAKQGNPYLKDEVSLGFDIGYERALEGRGIIGLNAFYRDVSDVIEDVGVGPAPDGGILFSYDNAGDGSIWGLEMDLNKPLSDNTGLFANLTLLDSKITDQFTGRERRFRDQSNYIYNLGVTHNIPEWDTSMGFSYQKQGDSLSVDIDRDVTLSYDGNLEVFIEKRFGTNYVWRLTGTNLLNVHKIESFDNYSGDSAAEIIENHINRNIDELETEDERASRVITLTFRALF